MLLEVERICRAKMIHANGDMEVSEKLMEAAKVLFKQPEVLL